MDIPILDSGLFRVGNETAVFGYYDPNAKWNGWRLPAFTKSTAQFVLEIYGDGKIQEIGLFDTVDGPVQLYTVNNYDWCWEII